MLLTFLLEFNGVKVLDWASLNPDLNVIEHLWKELKIAVKKREPRNLSELWQFCQEEWPKLKWCPALVDGYQRRIEAVIAAKGQMTKY